MSFPFISYAREDKAFVVRLDKALEAAGSTAWVDWQDIPPSARWMDEIRRAIVAADAFVFVISPSSASSRSCGWEISIAAENNKRIIPILLVPDESMTLPPAIGEINWIFATTSDELDLAVKQLTTAIGVDLEWVRWHSRLLNRAHEWRSANAEESLLLRGWDLEDAERRLAKAGDRQPPLTALQQEYVACGRWSERLDEANLLSRQSLLHAGRGRHQTAAAYRVRAMELAPQGGAPPGFRTSGQKADWAEDAWFLHRYQDRKRGRLRGRAMGQGAALSAVAVSPDDGVVASGDFDGGMRLWDAQTGEPLLTLNAHKGPVATIAFAPVGREIWTGSEDGTLLIWDLDATGVRSYFPDETDPVTSLAFAGDRVAIGLRNGFVAVVDRKTEQPVLHASPHSGAVTSLRFTDDGRLLTVSGRPAIGEWPGDGSVHALSLDDGRDQGTPVWNTGVGRMRGAQRRRTSCGSRDALGRGRDLGLRDRQASWRTERTRGSSGRRDVSRGWGRDSHRWLGPDAAALGRRRRFRAPHFRWPSRRHDSACRQRRRQDGVERFSRSESRHLGSGGRR